MGISQLGKGSQRGAHLLKELPHSLDILSDCLLGPHLDKAAWLCMSLAFSLNLNLTEDPEHRPEGSLNLPLPSWPHGTCFLSLLTLLIVGLIGLCGAGGRVQALTVRTLEASRRLGR